MLGNVIRKSVERMPSNAMLSALTGVSTHSERWIVHAGQRTSVGSWRLATYASVDPRLPGEQARCRSVCWATYERRSVQAGQRTRAPDPASNRMPSVRSRRHRQRTRAWDRAGYASAGPLGKSSRARRCERCVASNWRNVGRLAQIVLVGRMAEAADPGSGSAYERGIPVIGNGSAPLTSQTTNTMMNAESAHR
ncbi:hypothetical protein AVEN_247148-1 [Araneus ventricosus]|uniref:Uncharacterized protein n=1 Tax=Araneus ventricosus TaxID=182803 RepID=A0A4Y2KZI3_ARAVE|nr:hypothetical protein AVEN_247148-1 [Araneus ventricosus]